MSCGACGYDLTTLGAAVADPFWSCVCPECGARMEHATLRRRSRPPRALVLGALLLPVLVALAAIRYGGPVQDPGIAFALLLTLSAVTMLPLAYCVARLADERTMVLATLAYLTLLTWVGVLLFLSCCV